MGRRLYVGNLPYSTSEDQLTELFSRAGKVDNVRVMRDMATGRARGFAFVEMSTDEEAQKAISDLHEFQLEGRGLVVNEARPKPEGGFGGGGGGGRGRSVGGGGGGRGGGGGDDYGGGLRISACCPMARGPLRRMNPCAPRLCTASICGRRCPIGPSGG